MYNQIVHNFLLNVRLADGVDVLLLTLAISLLWQWLRKRATTSVAVVLIGTLTLYALADFLDLYMTLAVLRAGLTVLIFGLVVVFQDDLRYAFERLSAYRPFTRGSRSEDPSDFVSVLVEALTLLAKQKHGALVILPGKQSIERHMQGGVPIDALPSVDLIHSIFHPGSRGHDGAVIVCGQRLAWLGVHLPLSRDLHAPPNRGTRHSAALGLAERTDCCAIVVSEESGTISLAYGGELSEITGGAQELHVQLTTFLEEQVIPLTARQSGRLSRVSIYALSFAMAVLFWLGFAFRVETIQRTVEHVPIEFHDVPAGRVVKESWPSEVTLTLVGPQRAFDTLQPDVLRVAIDTADVPDREKSIAVQKKYLNLPEGIQLQKVEPAAIHVDIQGETPSPAEASPEAAPPKSRG